MIRKIKQDTAISSPWPGVNAQQVSAIVFISKKIPYDWSWDKLLIQGMEATHPLNQGWLGKETASEQTLQFRSRPLSRQVSPSDSRGAETGKHHPAGGTAREPTSLARGERESAAYRREAEIPASLTVGVTWLKRQLQRPLQQDWDRLGLETSVKFVAMGQRGKRQTGGTFQDIA